MAATMAADAGKVIVNEAKVPARAVTADAFSAHIVRGLWLGAGVLLLGSFIDLAVLWGLQFEGNPQWEFVASINTLEAYTRFGIAIALVYAALYAGRSTALWLYRLIGACVLLLGLVAAVLGLILVNDYFVLARLAGDQANSGLVVSVTKGILLSGTFTLLMVPIGILGLRRPRKV